MKLLVTRHGETEGNVKRILAGVKDELTVKGVEQAKKLAKRLKNEKIDAIYSSPILRAKRTTEEIVKYHKNVDFHLVDELREGDLGSYKYKPMDRVDWNNLPSDVENKTSLYRRAKKIVNKAFKKYPKGTVLFVAHNGINKAIIRVIKNLHPEDKISIPQHNTALTVCEINSKGKKIKLFNCTKHLE
ncbi:MAG: histidine phosphatase family protein [Candidatus Nanoarchaeia archaeon]